MLEVRSVVHDNFDVGAVFENRFRSRAVAWRTLAIVAHPPFTRDCTDWL